MRFRLALLAVLVAACTPQAPHPQANASTAVASCRLPVVSWYQPGNPVQLPPIGVQGHFVSYPDGKVSPDPQDEFRNSEDGFGWRSSATPALRGTGPVAYYDVAFKRFLPVPRAQVSPNGARYVYMDYTQGGLYVYGQMHVVDVATGHDRTLDLPSAQYMIFDFGAEGIYFTYGPYAQSAGLFLVDADSGKSSQVFQDGYVLAVAGGEAWVAVNEQDLHPTSPLPGGEGNATFPVLNVLLRRDVKTGDATEWLTVPNTSAFEFLGVYGRAPAVLVFFSDNISAQWSTGKVRYEVWLVSTPAIPETVDSGVNGDLQTDPWYRTGHVETSPSSSLGISDSHGIWLGGDAIYLYQPGHGLTKVASFPGFPANDCM